MDTTVLDLLFLFFVHPIIDISIILVPLVLFGFVIRFIKGRIDDVLINDFGKIPYYIFAFAGTPVHEASHLLSAILFRHKIKGFSLFSPDDSGRLGYVEHAYDPQSLYQRIGCFFVGIAPVIMGCLVLFGLTKFFLPRYPFPESVLVSQGLAGVWDAHAVLLMFKALIRDIIVIGESFAGNPPPLNWRSIVYLYLALGVGSHMYPSLSDFKGMLPGVLTLYFLVCLFDFWFRIIHVDMQTLAIRFVSAAGAGVSFMIFIVLLLALCFLFLLALKTVMKLFHKTP